MTEPRVLRRYDFDRPRPMVVEIHRDDCPCEVCSEPEPHARAVPDELDGRAIAKFAAAGFAAGNAAAFMILGPATAWHVLVAALLWRPL